MQKINKAFFRANFPKRPKNSYKNLNGKVLIVAGAADMPGAGVLCARAAYRAGAGFVTLATPGAVYNAAVAAVPEALVLKMPQKDFLGAPSLKKIVAYCRQNPQDILLIGPGLGKGAKILLGLLAAAKLPAVIDADALNFLAEQGLGKLPRAVPYILTPHQGEMRRLMGRPGPATAAELSAKTGAVALLKGPGTTVSYDGKTMQNTTGNAGLAKAGSGDALAGIIAGIWAQLARQKGSAAQTAFAAAALGVYLHGHAADIAAQNIPKQSLMASDVIEFLPQALKTL